LIGEQTIEESQTTVEPGRPTYQLILILASVILLILPFITTFNEFLTSIVMRLGLDGLLQGWVVPTEVRMIAVILRLFGIYATVSQTSLYLARGSGTLPIYISWNCVGYYVGQLPAVIFHDYGGTILILLWLFAFWYFAHGYLLEPSEYEESMAA